MLTYLQSTNSFILSPFPIEPSIDPRVLGPHQFLEHWRNPSMIAVQRPRYASVHHSPTPEKPFPAFPTLASTLSPRPSHASFHVAQSSSLPSISFPNTPAPERERKRGNLN